MNTDTTTEVTSEQLMSVIERIESLDAEKAVVNEHRKEVFAEAKANGFDTKTIQKVIAIRKKNRADFQEEQAMLDLYLNALGINL